MSIYFAQGVQFGQKSWLAGGGGRLFNMKVKSVDNCYL